jgi:hypothetical protein
MFSLKVVHSALPETDWNLGTAPYLLRRSTSGFLGRQFRGEYISETGAGRSMVAYEGSGVYGSTL